MRLSHLSTFAISCLRLATPSVVRAHSNEGLRVRGLTGEAGSSAIQRRAPDKTIPLVIDNLNATYQLNITVGTPGQSQSLELDFSGGTTWVNAANATYCQSSDCISVYDMNQSSTETTISGGFQVAYGDGTSVSGDWVNDTVGLSQDGNNYQISNVQFGVAINTTTTTGVLGLAYNSTAIKQVNQRTLPYLMYQQGFIDCICYSLWLNDATASQGRLIFGGVDTSKFQGNLATLPLHLGPYPTISLASVLTSQGNINTEITNVPSEVLIDAGTTLIYLPDNVTNPIYQQVDAVFDKIESVAVVDCQTKNSSISVGFTFAITNTTSTTILVPMSELVFSLNDTSCYLAIESSSSVGISILGVAFFRNAYIIYDFSHQQVSVAPANFFSTSDNVTAIAAGGVDASIDRGTGPLSATTSAVTTGTVAASTSTAPATPTTTSTTPTATSVASTGLSSGAKAGIGVGVSLGAIAVLAIAGFFLFRRRKRQQETAAAATTEDTRHEKPELDANGIQPNPHGREDALHEVDAPLYGTEAGRHELKSDGENTRHELRSDGENIRYELPSAQDASHELSSDAAK